MAATRWPQRWSGRGAVVVAAAGLLAVSCTGDDGAGGALATEGPAPSPPTATSTTAGGATISVGGTDDGAPATGTGEASTVGGGDADSDDTSGAGGTDASGADGAATGSTGPAGSEVTTSDGADDGTAGGASGEQPPGVGGPTPPTVADAASLDGAELEEFLARRYESFWLAFGLAREAPTANPSVDFPTLADLAVDEQLDAAYAELADMTETGRALRDPLERAVPGIDHGQSHRIRIEMVDGGSAELVACHVNDRESYLVADGTVINDQVVTVQAEATMVLTDGAWKLARSRAVDLQPGVAGCWLDGDDLYPW